jgi:hypothetical protein
MGAIDRMAAELGRRQHGLVTRRQLLARGGVERRTIGRRVDAGIWDEPHPGVLDLRTHVDSWRKRLHALVLAAGPDALASHRAAGHLHGFLDLPEPRDLDVLVPRGRHTVVGDLRLHVTRCAIDELGAVEVDDLPCTGVSRTLWDLARPGGIGQGALDRVVWDLARRRRRAELRAAASLVAAHAGAPGIASLGAALASVPKAAHLLGSVLEVDGLRALTSVGLAPPVLQHVIRDRRGRYVRRVDGAWPERSVALEFDGGAYHETTSARAGDQRVRARLTELGWHVVPIRATDLRGRRFDRLVVDLRRLVA